MGPHYWGIAVICAIMAHLFVGSSPDGTKADRHAGYMGSVDDIARPVIANFTAVPGLPSQLC